jgi:dTDP-glucose 4,6-dehydratase
MVVGPINDHTGMPVNITRCSNIMAISIPGKADSSMINNCLQGKKLPVNGDGMQIRDWLHV